MILGAFFQDLENWDDLDPQYRSLWWTLTRYRLCFSTVFRKLPSYSEIFRYIFCPMGPTAVKPNRLQVVAASITEIKITLFPVLTGVFHIFCPIMGFTRIAVKT
jgi:hypothetical protein